MGLIGNVGGSILTNLIRTGIGIAAEVDPNAAQLLSAIAGDEFAPGGSMIGNVFGYALGHPSLTLSRHGAIPQQGAVNVPDLFGRGTNSAASTALTNALGGVQGSGAQQVVNTATAFSSGPTFEQLKADIMKKDPNIKPEDANMMALQEEQQRYNRMLTLMTQLLQMKHEGLKGIIQNMRA